MYDVNPLGPLMHLKELERQAISTANRRNGRPNIGALLRERLAPLLRRINMLVAGRLSVPVPPYEWEKRKAKSPLR